MTVVGDPDSVVSPGGDFSPPVPTRKGGPDYGRFVDAVRDVQDHARAADAPDDVVSRAADLLEQVSALLAPFDTDEWHTPSGRRSDLPMRGNVLTIPQSTTAGEDGRLHGWARFRRFHLGRNGAVHGGIIAHLFDSVLGKTSFLLTGGPYQRTAYLHVNYRKIVPIDKELQVEASVSRVEGRKIFVEMRLCDGAELLADGEGLFVLLKPGQP
jgi:acyl-coenzyme A thioesterase PaaI-like protein